jgi:hypothetical protein
MRSAGLRSVYGKQESSLSVKQEFKLAYKVYAGESVVSPRRKTVQKPAKHTRAAAARLGLTERLVLKCIEEFEKGSNHDVAGAYSFTIADIVDYLVRRFGRRFGLSNEGYRLSKAIHKAVNRLVNRGIVVRVIKNGRRARGLYALRKDLARLLVGGFSLVNEPIEVLVEEFANSFVGNYVENNVGKVVGNSVFSPSKAGENLWGGVGVLGGGLNGVHYVGGFGVVRVHVINPPGGWVGYYVAVSVAGRVLSFVSSYVRGVLVSLYGISYVRGLDSLVNRVFDYVVSSARVDRGCHSRYNGSPGGFSPLSPDCVAHNYEYGIDLYVPGYIAQVVDKLINYVKVYVKTPSEIREANAEYYEDLLRVLGPPPPPPPGFNDLLARLGFLFDSRGSIDDL